jgi:fatty acid desaturase
MGGLIAVPFSVLAVLILGKRGAESVDSEPNTRLMMPTSEWVWKLAVIAIVYVILYFTFGYFVAWRHPGVPEYYGGTDPGSFAAQMATVLRNTPWLVPFQVGRALCWVAFALPVIRMLKGKWPETALAIGLLFAIVMNAPLLLPNPYMPEPVRMAHLEETASSNLIFGVFVGWLLTQRQSAKMRVAPAMS